MKKHFIFVIILFLTIFASGCGLQEKGAGSSRQVADTIIVSNSDDIGMVLIATKGESFNHPTFAVWVEDQQGKFVKTIFVTKSYASGIYGHGALTDSTWMNKPGVSFRPASLPYWTHKKGLIEGKFLIPTREHPYTDGYSGATPKSGFALKSECYSAEKFRVLLEVNQTWDWNWYWTNNKYPFDKDYKSSAQPSVVYAVDINLKDGFNEYALNPIGHGHYSGADGRLYTELNTLTTALKIFESVSLKLK